MVFIFQELYQYLDRLTSWNCDRPWVTFGSQFPLFLCGKSYFHDLLLNSLVTKNVYVHTHTNCIFWTIENTWNKPHPLKETYFIFLHIYKPHRTIRGKYQWGVYTEIFCKCLFIYLTLLYSSSHFSETTGQTMQHMHFTWFPWWDVHDAQND